MRESEDHNLELAKKEIRRLLQGVVSLGSLQERLRLIAGSGSVREIVLEISALMEQLVCSLYVRRYLTPNRDRNLSGKVTDLEKAGLIPDSVVCATRTAIALRNHFSHPTDRYGRPRQYPTAFAAIQVKTFELFLDWLITIPQGRDLICSIFPTVLSDTELIERLLRQKLSQELHASPISSSSYVAKAALAESRESVTIVDRNWKLPDDIEVPYEAIPASHTHPLEELSFSVATASVQPSVVGALAAFEKKVKSIDLRLYSFGVELLEKELKRDDSANLLITVDGAMAICADPNKFNYRRVLPVHNEFQWVLCRGFQGEPRLDAAHFIRNSTGEVQYWNFRQKGILPQKFSYVNENTIAFSIRDGKPNQGYIIWEPLANSIIEQGLAVKVPGIPRFTNWISLYVHIDTVKDSNVLTSLVSSFCSAWSECANDIDSVVHGLVQDGAYLSIFKRDLLLHSRNGEAEQQDAH